MEDDGTTYQIELEKIDAAWHVDGWDEFASLEEEMQNKAWALLAHRAKMRSDGIAHHSGVMDIPVERTEKPVRTWKPHSAIKGHELDSIPTEDYVMALTGEDVDTRRQACCPLPDHDDNTASFKAYDNCSWTCYGCNRGGRIFDFAAALWGIHGPLRGDTFREVRNRLRDVFG
jgi:hypothetical protein